MPEPVRRGITVCCSRCGRPLFDDPWKDQKEAVCCDPDCETLRHQWDEIVKELEG